MKSIIIIIGLFLIVGVIFAFSQKDSGAPTVTVYLTRQGAVRGNYGHTAWTNQTLMQFVGIPYGESPSGPLRFKPPVARLPWRYTFDATQTARRCPVITSITTLSEEELKEDLEDCLNLCVYTKNLTGQQAVIVNLYGGGFYNGSALDFPPGFLLEKDVVLVVPNSRLGVLGWATTFTKELPGNLPIMDLQLALDWVQRHIASFGGDPKKVTVIGQSAGAALAGALLVSPKTPRHHILRVVTQSGSIMAPWAINDNGHAVTVQSCRNLKCENCERDDAVYECLMAASVPELLGIVSVDNLSQQGIDRQNNVMFAPIKGDYHGVLPAHPHKLAANLTHPVTFMAGFTKHDGSFVLAVFWENLKQAFGDLKKMRVRDFANQLMNTYLDTSGLMNNLFSRLLFTPNQLNGYDHKKALAGYFDLTSVLMVKSPLVALSSQMINNRLADVFVYSFDYQGEHTRFGYEMGNEQYPFNGGVHHSDDNIYLFPSHKLNANDTVVARHMVEIFTSFAIDGRPRCMGGPPIQNMKCENGPYFHIGSEVSIGHDVLAEFTAALDDPKSDQLDRKDVEF